MRMARRSPRVSHMLLAVAADGAELGRHVSSRSCEGGISGIAGLPGRRGQGRGLQAGAPRSRPLHGTEGRRACPGGERSGTPPVPAHRGQEFLSRSHAQPRDMARDRAGRRRTFCGPTAGLRLTRRLGAPPGVRSNIPVTSAPAKRESLSDGGVPGLGPTQPIAPYRPIHHSAELVSNRGTSGRSRCGARWA